MHPPSLEATHAALLQGGRGILDLSRSRIPHHAIFDAPKCPERVVGVLLQLDEFLHLAGCDDHEMTPVRIDDLLVGVGFNGPLPTELPLAKRLADVRLLGARFVSWAPGPDADPVALCVFAAAAQAHELVPVISLPVSEFPALLSAMRSAGTALEHVLLRVAPPVPAKLPPGLGGIVLDIPWEAGSDQCSLLPDMPAEPVAEDDTPIIPCLIHFVPESEDASTPQALH